MPATLQRTATDRVWSTTTPRARTSGLSRHAQAVQIAGLDQRIRHKQSMARWLEALSLMFNALAVLAFVVAAGGMGAVFLSFRAYEPTVTGLVVFSLGFLSGACCLITRTLLVNGKRAIGRELEETVTERNRLRFLR